MEAQQEAQPLAPPQSSDLTDVGGGRTKAETEFTTADRNAQVQARREAIVKSARDKLKLQLRETRGIETPERVSEPVPQDKPSVSPAPVSNTQNTLAEAFTTQLNQQFQSAQALRDEAVKYKAEAEVRANEAEAKLNKFLANPATYLQETGLNMDQWNARLLNGGEQTPEEKLRAEVLGVVAPLKAELDAERRNRAVAEIKPVLKEHFPLVNHLLGPDGALEEVNKQAAAARRVGKLFTSADVQAVIQGMEDTYLSAQQTLLQDSVIAAKVGIGVKSSPVVAVAPSPHTLTNRVTSSVPSVSTRATSDRDRIARGREMLRKLVAAGQI